jgi:exportin-T
LVGFPTLPKGATCDQSWAAVFVEATEIILNVLRTYNQVQLIRDSARFSFSRFITCLGADILPYLPNLINELLTDCQITELVDFLPFVGMVAHKYRVTHV